MTTPPPNDEVPAESRLLNDAYVKSGLTVADIADATGMSVGSVRIALAGMRYRDGEPKRTVPSDPTVAKLAALLGVSAATLREIGRQRAATILEEGKAAVSAEPDLTSVAAIAGRQSVVREVLAVFSTEELRAELERRETAEPDRRRGPRPRR